MSELLATLPLLISRTSSFSIIQVPSKWGIELAAEKRWKEQAHGEKFQQWVLKYLFNISIFLFTIFLQTTFAASFAAGVEFQKQYSKKPGQCKRSCHSVSCCDRKDVYQKSKNCQSCPQIHELSVMYSRSHTNLCDLSYHLI